MPFPEIKRTAFTLPFLTMSVCSVSVMLYCTSSAPVNPGGIAGRRLPDAPFTFRTRIDTQHVACGRYKFRFMSKRVEGIIDSNPGKIERTVYFVAAELFAVFFRSAHIRACGHMTNEHAIAPVLAVGQQITDNFRFGTFRTANQLDFICIEAINGIPYLTFHIILAQIIITTTSQGSEAGN